MDPLNARLAEYAYAAIRDDIIAGRVAPSGRLVQDELARRLGISRTPVREAMSRLEHEGLVRLIPGRGAIVQRVTPQDILGIYEVREELERLAVRLAARDGRAYDVAALRRLVAEMERVDPTRVADYYRLNRAFHLQMAAASANAALVGALESLWDQAINFHLFTMYSTEELRRLVTPHAVLADAAERGDPAELVRAVGEHIAEARGNLLRKLRNSQADGGRLAQGGMQ
jgi:DNA-binding GntR family transcriptional regulator